jgi:hypothetical protein
MVMDLFDESIPLEMVVTKADEAFRICQNTAIQPNKVDFPSLALHRHMIHMARGVQVLISHKASISILPLLRSMLESFFSLKYIHLREYEQRSLCWLCAHIHQEIELKELLDPNSRKSKEFHAKAREQIDGWSSHELKPDPRVAEELEDLKRFLKDPDIEPIDEEFRRLQEMDIFNRPPKWHRLFRGVKNIWEMANEIRLLPMYQVFYTLWSRTVHGTDYPNLCFLHEDGTIEFNDLVDSEVVTSSDGHVRLFLVQATKLMVDRFVSSAIPNTTTT